MSKTQFFTNSFTKSVSGQPKRLYHFIGLKSFNSFGFPVNYFETFTNVHNNILDACKTHPFLKDIISLEELYNMYGVVIFDACIGNNNNAIIRKVEGSYHIENDLENEKIVPIIRFFDSENPENDYYSLIKTIPQFNYRFPHDDSLPSFVKFNSDHTTSRPYNDPYTIQMFEKKTTRKTTIKTEKSENNESDNVCESVCENNVSENNVSENNVSENNVSENVEKKNLEISKYIRNNGDAYAFKILRVVQTLDDKLPEKSLQNLHNALHAYSYITCKIFKTLPLTCVMEMATIEDFFSSYNKNQLTKFAEEYDIYLAFFKGKVHDTKFWLDIEPICEINKNGKYKVGIFTNLNRNLKFNLIISPTSLTDRLFCHRNVINGWYDIIYHD